MPFRSNYRHEQANGRTRVSVRNAKKAAIAAFFLCPAPPAAAHEASGGLVLLLPTGNTMVGAAAAVAASALLLAIAPRLKSPRLVLPLRMPALPEMPVSVLSTLFVLMLIWIGRTGPDDPLSNPIGYGVWTLGWICMSLFAAVFGNPWPWCNPWTGLLALIGNRPRFALPEGAAGWIACGQFLIFAWIDLISPYNMDPERLAIYLAVYWAANLIAMALFGSTWFGRAEPLGLFFRLLGRLSSFGRDGHGRLTLTLPGARASEEPPPDRGETAFVLLALSSASFDGLADTFRWLTVIGVNPLEFPGRSEVEEANTIGLLGAWAVLSILYLGTVRAGEALAGVRVPGLAARLVVSLLPILVVFHAAHFTVRLIMDGQYLWRIASDPLVRGWDLFGTAHYHVSASMFSDPARVALVWAFQTGVITLGHIVGIAIAHAVAMRALPDPRRAVLSQLPLATLMVAYTVFGLWLLAAPKI
ncbi:hypothetical protein D2T31_20010 [Sinirhodobacter populi]|uniref:Fenitrothion hydrolase n=1 Tax=Paenirhodobacter populi TaxID=2306993 RepID=A0A443K0T5_9RHOB|nr:hypothetical protein [Sinirhodobacter populi]RWR26398.1 hypothetical protein D2T31_20010 [Sinirhodobacter populi]